MLLNVNYKWMGSRQIKKYINVCPVYYGVKGMKDLLVSESSPVGPHHAAQPLIIFL